MRELGWLGEGKRRLRGDPIAAHSSFWGSREGDRAELVPGVVQPGGAGHQIMLLSAVNVCLD